MMAAIYLPQSINQEDLKIKEVDWLNGIKVPAYGQYPESYVRTWMKLLGI